jgi:broad specificity phosphatase PhoE
VNESDLKESIIRAIWEVVDRTPQIVSATITGSFSVGSGLAGISDIDTILIVHDLTASRFQELQDCFRSELEEPLSLHGFALRINPTLGPLKFNDDHTAVLHLMIYSSQRHREHVIQSPFTCLDWQRSPLCRKASLKEIYPVFALQPRHFINARRSASDYLRDLNREVVTFRELTFSADGYQEVQRCKPMTIRDRHEFAYHIMRFLMQNFLKLVRRENESEDGGELLTAYFEHFPQGADRFRPFYEELNRRKMKANFEEPIPRLSETATEFVQAFEAQFIEAFEQQATRHLVFRHAPTPLNRSTGASRVFQGRTDTDIFHLAPEEMGPLCEAVQTLRPAKTFTSPLLRAQSSLRVLGEHLEGLPPSTSDERLKEIDYGECEGKTVAQCKQGFPKLFAAWQRGEDPQFPGGGENTEAVLRRGQEFSHDRWQADGETSLSCTHNVVLRTMIGQLFSIPRAQWHRLNIPHLVPITLIATKRFGLFAEFSEDVEREIFSSFFHN